MLLFKHRKYSFIPWGIGWPASYGVKYDDSKKSCVYLIKKNDQRVMLRFFIQIIKTKVF